MHFNINSQSYKAKLIQEEQKDEIVKDLLVILVRKQKYLVAHRAHRTYWFKAFFSLKMLGNLSTQYTKVYFESMHNLLI